MKIIKKKIIAGALGAALMFAAIAGVSASEQSAGGSKNGEVPVVTGQLVDGDPSQWGFAAHTKGDPSQWGFTSNVAGDPSQWGVTRNVVGDPSQWGVTASAGGSKNGDIPVVGG